MNKLHKALMMPWTNKVNYTQIVQQTAPANLLAYWPMAEASGSVALDASGNGRNGAYTAVTLGAAGIGDGRTAASFDGSTSFNNIYSASLAGAFSDNELTLSCWIFPTNLSGTTVRRFFYLQADSSNRVFITKTSTASQVQFAYISGGTTNQIFIASFPINVWSHMAITVSKSGDAMKAYRNGTQSGATQTGVGVWVGALASTLCCVGANDTVPNNVAIGRIAHAAIWSTPLSAAQIAALAVVP